MQIIFKKKGGGGTYKKSQAGKTCIVKEKISLRQLWIIKKIQNNQIRQV